MENEHFLGEKNQKIIVEDHTLTSKDLGDGVVYKPTISMDNIVIKQPPKYIGLTKEELQRYADDPFWKRLRWALLILFWLAWIAMFVAAIVIVATSPKCPPKPVLKWWQKKVCYQVWTPSFRDSDGDGLGDLNGITERLGGFSDFKIKISSIWAVPLLDSKSGSGYDVRDFKNIDPKLGTMNDFDNLIKKIHENDMKFIMDIPLSTVSTTHEWFINNTDYFKWNNVELNNKYWSRLHNPNSPRHNQYYYTWENQPNYAILNWNSTEVQDKMKEVLEFWLNKGVDGFYFGLVDYIATAEDDTPDWLQIHESLSNLSRHVRNFTDREILLFSSIDLSNPPRWDNFQLEAVTEGELDYVINSHLINASKNELCNGECIYEELKRVNDFHAKHNRTWPMWELGSPYHSRIATRMKSKQKSELMTMLLLMLPGAVNVYYGDEIGMEDVVNAPLGQPHRSAMLWNTEKNAGFSKSDNISVPIANSTANNLKTQIDSEHATMAKMFRRMVELRNKDEAFLFGNTTVRWVNETYVTVFRIRTTSSAADYVGVLNFDSDVDELYNMLPVIQNVTGHTVYEVTAAAMTTNLAIRKDTRYFEQRPEIDVAKLNLRKNEGILLKLKPKK